MSDAGSALMGIGSASGENRAIDAAKAAIDSPLLDVSIDGAKGILFTITGGSSLTMHEINESAKVITEKADSSAKIIFGSVVDDSMKDDVKVTVIATGFDDALKPRHTEKKEENSKTFGFKWPGGPQEIAEDGDNVAGPAIRTKTIKDQPRVSDKLEQDDNDDLSGGGDDDLEIPTFIRKKMM